MLTTLLNGRRIQSDWSVLFAPALNSFSKLQIPEAPNVRLENAQLTESAVCGGRSEGLKVIADKEDTNSMPAS